MYLLTRRYVENIDVLDNLICLFHLFFHIYASEFSSHTGTMDASNG